MPTKCPKKFGAHLIKILGELPIPTDTLTKFDVVIDSCLYLLGRTISYTLDLIYMYCKNEYKLFSLLLQCYPLPFLYPLMQLLSV